MRAKLLALVIVGIAFIFALPLTTTGQPGGKKQGFGGYDPGGAFDRVANGRPSVPISEIVKGFGKDFAAQYAQERGITNGQFTRTQYLEFSAQLGDQMKAKYSGGGDKSGKKVEIGGGGGITLDGGFGKKKGFEMPAIPGGPSAAPPSIDVINQLADADFKRRDSNGDDKLNVDEMPGPLRFGLTKWDKNNDGLIDRNEYRDYFASRLGGGGDDSQGTKGIASILIDEDELDRKTVVFREGGKVPAGLPSWFKELQVDGQVPYYAWRGAKRSHDEFKTWDLNDDALITMEEAMKVSVAAKGGPRSPGDTSVSVSSSSSSSSDRPSWGSGGKDKRGPGGPPGQSGDNNGGKKKKFGGFGG